MKYFSIKELCSSNTARIRGIKNDPTPEVERNLTLLVDRILDPLREAWGKPITVTSGYRCPELNKAVGGAATSQHMQGCAADLDVGTQADNMKLFKLIQEMNLPFDQLLFEKGNKAIGPDWVHVSYSSRNRHEIRYIR